MKSTAQEESSINARSSGTWKITPREEKFYQNNQLRKRITYYPGGKKSAEEEYANGKLDGIMKEYYESGNLRAEKNISGRYIKSHEIPRGWPKRTDLPNGCKT
ncbi:MAG: hypothetical protein MZV63_26635 [Marinilabiliales bacterium]|nr:hypothetical protein [Marinilabiliales bacterium]